MTVTERNEKIAERVGIIAQQREINDKAITEKRALNAEEQTKYDKMEADANAIKAFVDRDINLEKAEKESKNPSSESVRAALDPATPEGLRATPEYRKAYTAWMKHGDSGIPMEIKATLQKAVNTSGGYLVPIDFETKIVEKLYDANIMRQLGTVIRTTSQNNIPMEGNLPTFGWIDELGTYPSADLTVGQKILSAYKLGGIITCSEELMDDAFIDIASYVASRSALAAGFAEESAYTLGDGNKKPTGWLTTIAAAATTVTSAVAAKVTSVDMFTLMYSVARPYRKNGTFVVADSAISGLRQEKSTTGQYLWMPALTADAPDTYLGKRIETSDYLAAVAAGSISAAFGDFSYYQIVDRVGWSMQMLKELYAATGQVGFRMWERTDGMLLRPEAINTLTTHA